MPTSIDSRLDSAPKEGKLSYQITIQGVVQGVGFRPFIFRLAHQHKLTGFVLNTVSGVLIEAQGSFDDLQSFIHFIPLRKPPNASILALEVKQHSSSRLQDLSSFTIKTSCQTGITSALVPTDTDICTDCLKELLVPGNRRYLYPFINCTNCGPRFTIITDLPYDRAATSMRTFKLCPICATEYHDPHNRRFHAQPNACPTCGPHLSFINSQGNELPGSALENCQSYLAAGKIVTIKGIGGFHLAVNAMNKRAVDRLRKLKNRPSKPLAVMAKDLEAVRKFAKISKEEEELLTNSTKPIVLLNKRDDFTLASSVAPKNKYIGTMLPYSPLHHLLFLNSGFSSLVMTSGNLAGEPIAINQNQALAKLAGVADYFLSHNRDILTSCDDSVVKIEDKQPVFIRRSRSYAPLPIKLPFDCGTTLALGGAMKNSICLSKGKHYYLSQHIGDLQHYESVRHFESVIKHLARLLQIEPKLLVHDMHPDYPSTAYAKQRSVPTVAVQHHHAHAASCMAENGLNEAVLAITLDGAGYGDDQTIWGGEILITEFSKFTRVAHLQQFQLPGGDLAAKQPWRCAISCLHQTLGEKIHKLKLPLLEKHIQELPTIIAMLKQNINAPLTSSCGRLFDCVASLLNIRHHTSYEGEAACDLEMAAGKDDNSHYPYEIVEDHRKAWQISWQPMLMDLLKDLEENIESSVISNLFHNTLVQMFSSTCYRLRELHNINKVVLSGGVFQNQTLSSRLQTALSQKGFQVFTHHLVPTNDGGLCLGQAVAGRHIAINREQ